MAFALVALFSKCVKMQRTLFDAGLKRTNTITVDNSPDSCPSNLLRFVPVIFLNLSATTSAEPALTPLRITPSGLSRSKNAVATRNEVNIEAKGRSARLSNSAKLTEQWMVRIQWKERRGDRNLVSPMSYIPRNSKSSTAPGQRQLADCDAYIVGTNSVKLCAVHDHEKTEGHEAARQAAFAKDTPHETPI